MITGEGVADRQLSRTDMVIEGIKDLITRGELVRGDRLPVEKDLAAQLGVSRGALREGVRALVILGVLDTRQGAGTYVTTLHPDRLLSPIGFLAELQDPTTSGDLLALRRVLESESAARAALRLTQQQLDDLTRALDDVEALLDTPNPDLEAFIEADSAFHRIIARASGNAPLAALIDSLVTRTFRTRLWRAIDERGAVGRTQGEHRAILAELRRRDPDAARLRMAVHVLGVEDFVHDHTVDQ